jgi:hypothetical protein
MLNLNSKTLILSTDYIYLWSKVVCFVSHINISQTITLHAILLISSESSQWEGVHWLCFRLFGVIMWKLLIIEPFFQRNINNIWGHSWCCWKALSKSYLFNLIRKFSELRCERCWFLNGYCCWKFKKNLKIKLERKNQLNPQCIHIANFRNFQF